MRRIALVPLAILGIALCGCPEKKAPAPATFHSESHGHSHERNNMMLEDVGKLAYHAALTAHLSSKDGNELDIFFETTDEPPKSAPLALEKFTATAKTADGKTYTLEFEPAPKDERKDDPDGKCSHFVAKAGWMKPEYMLTITTTVTINNKPAPIQWKDFNPKKYAHHID
jgi:hypothetical protein